jgi:gas vesicle protein
MMFSIGIGIGVVLGASLAVMFAPRSGDEMRRALRDRASRVAERARLVGRRGARRVEEIAQEVREPASSGEYVSDYPR